MSKLTGLLSGSAVALAALILPSCAMEDPFKADGEGELTLTTEINGDIVKTRAVEGDELSTLREKCVVYIENGQGVVRKFKGLDNIPASFKLQTGEYVAEAWSGDSVSASFGSKFYRGYEKFEIKEGENSLTLKCNIANVLVSVDPKSLEIGLDNLTVTFSHSRGELVFNQENIPEAKGYFMMPSTDSDIAYKIEGTKKSDGSAYLKEGKIPDVKRAHEYSLLITEDKPDVNDGGALIQITIADIPLIEETFEICPGPSVRGIGFNLADQLVSAENSFTDKYVAVKCYEGMSSILLTFGDNFTTPAPGQYNILKADAANRLEAAGITYESKGSKDASAMSDGEDIDVDEVFIKFSAEFLNGLSASDKEYVITIEAIDEKHREGMGSLRIATTEGAVEVLSPVTTAAAPNPAKEPMAIGARRATLSGVINDPAAAQNYGIKYREQSQSEWQKAYPADDATLTRGSANIPYSVTLTGLTPGTTYEYIAFCDEFDSDVINTFKTEEVFPIPNSSFEDWGTYGNKIVVPGLTGDKTTCFWGSGNEGSSMAGQTLTNSTQDIVRTGDYAVKLASSQALGVLAAGNVFTGYFKGTNHIKYGEIVVGRPYNGSHPSKVRVYCNYRPGAVDITKSEAPLEKNQKDHGQIYIGLVTEPLTLNTYDTKTLFTPENYRSKLIAYGQVTLTDDYGADKELLELDIPFEYYDMAQTVTPGYLVIVATASKYGDYYAGSSKSVMILDDVELIYE